MPGKTVIFSVSLRCLLLVTDATQRQLPTDASVTPTDTRVLSERLHSQANACRSRARPSLNRGEARKAYELWNGYFVRFYRMSRKILDIDSCVQSYDSYRLPTSVRSRHVARHVLCRLGATTANTKIGKWHEISAQSRSILRKTF